MLKFPFVFDDFTHENYEHFLQTLAQPNNLMFEIWPEEPEDGEPMSGLVNVSNVQPYMDGLLHFLFFDRKLRGKEDVLMDVVREVMRTMELRRLTCAIPSDRATGLQMLQRLGFRREGKMRKKFLRKGKYLDVYIYSILEEEVE